MFTCNICGEQYNTENDSLICCIAKRAKIKEIDVLTYHMDVLNYKNCFISFTCKYTLYDNPYELKGKYYPYCYTDYYRDIEHSNPEIDIRYGNDLYIKIIQELYQWLNKNLVFQLDQKMIIGE